MTAVSQTLMGHDVIRQEAHDKAAQHGGGLSSDEQRVLNQELDNAAHAIGE